MSMYRLASAAAAGAMWVGASAWADDAAKWGAHIDLEGKVGSKRSLGEADLFLPLAQNADSLLFADIRTRMDDQSSREGNFGLGVRHMLESGWNVGGYGFFDRRRSEYHNYFNQMTLGAEALSLDWDLRANGYVPIGRRSYNEDSLNTAEISGASVVFRGGEERSLGGFDAEIGWRLPVFSADAGQQLRVFAGGYRFADEGVPTVAGPRGRAEMVFDEVPGLWDGSRLSLGAEWQHDDPRGSQGFLSARLRIPLQAEASPSRLTPMERRMADPIIRDIDVVAQGGAYGAAETATASNGGAITVINSASTSNIATAITNAGANSTVILSGTFNTSANSGTTIALQTGQTVMGGGSMTVRSPSGRTATLTSASGATIAGTYTSFATNKAIVEMATNSTLTGVTLNQTGTGGVTLYGIYAIGKTGVVISNNTITANNDQNYAQGIFLDTGASATISGNTITAYNSNGGGGFAFGIRVSAASATIANNTISATSAVGGVNQASLFRNNGTGASPSAILSGSTGNVFRTTAGCRDADTVSGTLFYTNSSGAAATCP